MTKKEIIGKLVFSFWGMPYKYGGNSPLEGGLDCSGFVCELLRSVGEIGKEDYNAQMLFDHFKSKEINLASVDEHDIIFFGKSKTEISHVAIALNDDLMIEAGGGDHTTISLVEALKHNAYIRVRPISNRRDLVGVIRLF